MKKKLHDLASILNISSVTLERWIVQGRIPVSAKNGYCEFDPEILQEWALKRKISFRLSCSGCTDNMSGSGENLLYRAVKAGGIYYDIIAENPESVIRKIAGLIPLKDGCLLSANDIAAALDERERIRSTGVGRGVAVPHPLQPIPELFSESVAMICFLSQAVDFSSPDSIPVRIVFPVFASSRQEHLKLLSEISLCIRDVHFMNMLENVADRQTIMSGIASFRFP